jgi:NADH-quinone oxidoreductase subunit E
VNTPRNPHPATAISRGPLKSALSSHLIEEIKALPANYPQPRSAVMPALDLAQEELGHLTPEAMSEVAVALQLDPGYVEGVATFYTLFHLEPVGKHHFYVCTNLSCTLRGAEEIVEHLRGAIEVKEAGEVSADGLFSYEEVECMGACEYAPMCRVDHRYHYDLTAEKVDALVAERKSPSSAVPGTRPHPAPQAAPTSPPGGEVKPVKKPRKKRASG